MLSISENNVLSICLQTLRHKVHYSYMSGLRNQHTKGLYLLKTFSRPSAKHWLRIGLFRFVWHLMATVAAKLCKYKYPYSVIQMETVRYLNIKNGWHAHPSYEQNLTWWRLTYEQYLAWWRFPLVLVSQGWSWGQSHWDYSCHNTAGSPRKKRIHTHKHNATSVKTCSRCIHTHKQCHICQDLF